MDYRRLEIVARALQVVNRPSQRLLLGLQNVSRSGQVLIGGRQFLPLGDGVGGKVVASARSILHDELLAKTFAKPISEEPRTDVSRAARRVADDDMWLSGRIVGRRRTENADAHRNQGEATHHEGDHSAVIPSVLICVAQ